MALTTGLLLETKQLTYFLSSDKKSAPFSSVALVVTKLSFRRKHIVVDRK